MPQEKAALQAWSALLVVRADDTFESLDRIGRVMQLPKITKEVLSAVRPPLAPIYFEWVTPIETAFKAHRLVGNLAEFMTPINTDARKTLQFCADRLSELSPEKMFESADLSRVRREATELRSELEKAEIDSDLKKFAWRHLKEIITALDEYEFFGVNPLQRASDGALGSAAQNREAVSRLQATPVGRKLFGFLAKTLIMLSALHGAVQIPQDIQRFLIDARPTVESPHSEVPQGQPSVRSVPDPAPIEIVSDADDGNGAAQRAGRGRPIGLFRYAALKPQSRGRMPPVFITGNWFLIPEGRVYFCRCVPLRQDEERLCFSLRIVRMTYIRGAKPIPPCPCRPQCAIIVAMDYTPCERWRCSTRPEIMPAPESSQP